MKCFYVHSYIQSRSWRTLPLLVSSSSLTKTQNFQDYSVTLRLASRPAPFPSRANQPKSIICRWYILGAEHWGHLKRRFHCRVCYVLHGCFTILAPPAVVLPLTMLFQMDLFTHNKLVHCCQLSVYHLQLPPAKCAVPLWNCWYQILHKFCSRLRLLKSGLP